MTKSVEPRPTFLSYVARNAERPAFKRFATQSSALAEQLKSNS